jgi:hypothetical protein
MVALLSSGGSAHRPTGPEDLDRTPVVVEDKQVGRGAGFEPAAIGQAQ